MSGPATVPRRSHDMIDLNHILLFLACISPLVLLARTRRALGLHRTWRLAAMAVLLVTGVVWVFAPDQAGFIGGGAWFALLLVPAVGLRRIRDLLARGRFPAARRTAAVIHLLHPSRELVELRKALDLRARGGEAAPGAEAVLRSWVRSRSSISEFPLGNRQVSTPAVFLFIGLNLVMFVAEMAAGGTTNPQTLHRLGALDWYSVLVEREYWRLGAALFLHFGALHLLFNLYALYVLGVPLERTLGSIRFAVSYLAAGLGSTTGVIALRLIGWTRADLLVGASGCVMGVIGAWAGLLIRHRHTPFARRRLQNILLVVAVQAVFDLSTPQVSMAAHFAGLLTGFAAGLILAPRRLSA